MGFRHRVNAMLLAAIVSMPMGVDAAEAQQPEVQTEVRARGQTVYAPEVNGPAEVVVAIITLPPGSSTGWHWHAGTVTAVVSQGQLTRYEHDGCSTLFATGSVILEVPDDVHEGRNETTDPVELVATYVTPIGEPLSLPAVGPSATCAQGAGR
jgi:quercetin dioxygenase-like cupin family protein